MATPEKREQQRLDAAVTLSGMRARDAGGFDFMQIFGLKMGAIRSIADVAKAR